jgi:hypothetical protein
MNVGRNVMRHTQLEIYELTTSIILELLCQWQTHSWYYSRGEHLIVLQPQRQKIRRLSESRLSKEVVFPLPHS